VFINDIPAPILYSGDQQINAVVPSGVAGQTTARVRIGSSPDFHAAVLPAIPQIFAPALNQDGTVNSFENPAPVGSVMTIWVTGFGPVSAPDGQIATGAEPFYVGSLFAGAVPVTIRYAGVAPGLIAGVAQINFVVPDHWSVVLTSGNYASPEFPIFVVR
jgi:uncharacterized protein (TIGR03437 family)